MWELAGKVYFMVLNTPLSENEQEQKNAQINKESFTMLFFFMFALYQMYVIYMPCVLWPLCIESCTLLVALQSLVARLKENLEKLMEERDHCSTTENREKEQNKRLQRQIRDVKEEMGELAKKEGEASRKKHELVGTTVCMLF